ncbi:MAG: tRNA uridine-5-carboxymethylaminomethyl(34) synthesis GTPase MnmE [Burkholderiales bacterium]|uniref:tRNA uridine-5-carboxymethylaminomethyl(34) synthesis GTPase MnmE n=1 Tax=Ottowia sp. TaxID=1898956 RepID=UPI001ACE7B35|nr:tRNA uridine-5-carboxymethylaminomethyl(34) synthesis GTPase MnmE [Ottowia sp.]MBN9405717.1 tRNA uridine-5-carboxymethylaminomethyl(34) synthesis GTPase MnmE [Burkholderiales bacterium]MBS0401034.1 tRNA uridine-5-carboxymethylaminomethyl(34) synthesis GTPase MnmE [Pseudomonadota bacterium]
MHAAPDPIVAIATAPGRGAVGIVRVSGRGLLSLARALTGRTPAPRHASYGAFADADGSPIDHGLALYFAAPQSYTGEDVLELQAHGGPVVLQLLLARCLQAAAQIEPASGQPVLPRLRLARPGEFTERAFLNDKLDLAQAEAVMDLIDASTEQAARSASRSLAGDFSREIERLTDGLIQLRMLIEATLDFPEEEIDVLSAHDVRGQLSKLQQTLRDVQARARQGALLREGIQVVIAGQPNAGKSSLLNALAGAELAIVTPIAGTTRDVVRQTIQIEGVPLHVLDTAGLRAAGDAVEQIGIERAWQHIEQADAVLWLHDLTRQGEADYAAGEQHIAEGLATRSAAGVPLLHLWNKHDAAPDAAVPEGGIALSARTGEGLDALRQRLLQLVGWQGGAGEGLFIARERHLQALARAAAHLEAAGAHLAGAAPMLDLLAEELRLAQNALGEITGQFTADDLLGVIFARFCIGK